MCLQQTSQKVRKKVFNRQRFICTEFTSYKLHILIEAILCDKSYQNEECYKPYNSSVSPLVPWSFRNQIFWPATVNPQDNFVLQDHGAQFSSPPNMPFPLQCPSRSSKHSPVWQKMHLISVFCTIVWVKTNDNNNFLILQPFLAIFPPTIWFSFTKRRFRRSFWGA